MAKDARIEARLLRWAEWVTVGDGSGYPAVCTLHEDWSPPAPGQRPTLKVGAGSDVWSTHRAVGRLGLRLRNAVVVHYVIKGPVQRQADLLECAVDTVHGRVERAHEALLYLFAQAGGSAPELCNNQTLV